MTEAHTAEGVYRELIGRILSGRSGLQQIWFVASVLGKYLEGDDYQVLRTDSAGRLGKRRSWSVDFGIVDGTDDLPTLRPVLTTVRSAAGPTRGKQAENRILM